LLFQLTGDSFQLHQRIAFAEDVDHLHLLKLMAEGLMLPKLSCRNLVEALLRFVGQAI
jgi:hypothetical protein